MPVTVKKGGSDMQIALDPGHGGNDAGAVYNGIREADIVLNLCLMVKAMYSLICPADKIILTRNGDINRSLSQRARFANDRKADVFFSLHMNADPDEDMPGMPEAHGSEIWIHPQAGRKTKIISNRLAGRLGIDDKFRGIKEENFAVLRLTKMPAILIEAAFMDNVSGLEAFTSPKNLYLSSLKLVNAINHALI
jgi:N-acetylmuramoyl-L-alanine amidase